MKILQLNKFGLADKDSVSKTRTCHSHDRCAQYFYVTMRLGFLTYIIFLILFCCCKTGQDNNNDCLLYDSSNPLDKESQNQKILTDLNSIKFESLIDSVICGEKTIKLKTVLIPLKEGEPKYSVKEGRDLLVAILYDRIIYEFTEIDGYSSLFLSDAKIEHVKIDEDEPTLVVFNIKPHESLRYIWLYQLINCDFRYIAELRADSMSIESNRLVIKNSLLYDNWDDMIQVDIVLSYLSHTDSSFDIQYEHLYSKEIFKISNHKLIQKERDSKLTNQQLIYLSHLREKILTLQEEEFLHLKYPKQFVLKRIENLIN